MQPIQTLYKGYRFRSRLEARWAVFLDALSANWSYEKEGFILSDTWYLPDFWVKDWNAWVEIKGMVASDAEKRKCELLAQASGKRVLLLSGEPWIEDGKNVYDITLFGPHGFEHNGTSGWEFGEGRRCANEIWLVSEDHGAFTLRPVPHVRDDKYPLSGSHAETVIAALAAARGARFEHSESGGV
jgi:hypothetical protein